MTCIWTNLNYWPTGNESDMYKIGCKQFKREKMGRGWNFCPYCGKPLLIQAESHVEESLTANSGGSLT